MSTPSELWRRRRGANTTDTAPTLCKTVVGERMEVPQRGSVPDLACHGCGYHVCSCEQLECITPSAIGDIAIDKDGSVPIDNGFLKASFWGLPFYVGTPAPAGSMFREAQNLWWGNANPTLKPDGHWSYAIRHNVKLGFRGGSFDKGYRAPRLARKSIAGEFFCTACAWTCEAGPTLNASRQHTRHLCGEHPRKAEG